MINNLVKGNTGDWEVVIGLEIHAQVSSNSKLFSRSDTSFGAEPNTQVSLVDSAMPGMLPTINEYCVEQAVRTGLGINAKVNLRSVFDRKNYFYADLPQGYQISQFSDPIIGEGQIEIDLEDGTSRPIGIERIHLEQDAGKSMHDQVPDSSLVDFNRTGVALMELVTHPDMRSSAEAAAFMKKFRTIVRYLGTCDGDMEKGSMRCDANVSVRKAGTTALGTRNEIKNLNSIKNIQLAIDYEVRRQIDLIESGGVVEQATRLFNVDEGVTKVMRSKEDAHDYRYFPDPDLYPLVIEQSYVDAINDNMPELPDAKKKRYINDLSLSPYDASVLVSDKKFAIYFEELAKNTDAKLACNWLTGELFGRLSKKSISFDDNPISAERLSGLLKLISDDVISGKIAKDVLDIMFEGDKNAEQIVEEKGLKQVTNTAEIESIIDDVIANNPNQLEQYKAGKVQLFGFFVGQVMKATQGKANPKVVNELLKAKL